MYAITEEELDAIVTLIQVPNDIKLSSPRNSNSIRLTDVDIEGLKTLFNIPQPQQDEIIIAVEKAFKDTHFVLTIKNYRDPQQKFKESLTREIPLKLISIAGLDKIRVWHALITPTHFTGNPQLMNSASRKTYRTSDTYKDAWFNYLIDGKPLDDNFFNRSTFSYNSDTKTISPADYETQRRCYRGAAYQKIANLRNQVPPHDWSYILKTEVFDLIFNHEYQLNGGGTRSRHDNRLFSRGAAKVYDLILDFVHSDQNMDKDKFIKLSEKIVAILEPRTKPRWLTLFGYGARDASTITLYQRIIQNLKDITPAPIEELTI